MRQPNILMVIADDHSWPHTSAYGCRFVETPGFDEIAAHGVLFDNAYCPSPQCSPSRACLLTGRNMWELKEGSVLWGFVPKEFEAYPDLLERSGYAVGFTGKGWGPGSFEAGGRTRNPAGPEYNTYRDSPPSSQQVGIDYYRNFVDFMERRDGRPFCFWMGPHEPHRAYEKGSGLRYGPHTLDQVDVPPYLPDSPEVRSDFLDYSLEIEWYDRHLQQILRYLKETGEFENTIILSTGDNGMPFPRAKANLLSHSCRVPLAVCYGEKLRGPRRVTDFVSFIDIFPTILEALGLKTGAKLSGRSFWDVLCSQKEGRVDPERNKVFWGRERHTPCHDNSEGYSSRGVKTDDFLFVWNFEPEKYPSGDPKTYYADVDDSPTKDYVIGNRDDAARESFTLCFEKRPRYELYDAREDPYCLKNLAGLPAYREPLREMEELLREKLLAEGDPRILGYGEIYNSYPYYCDFAWKDQLEGFLAGGYYNTELYDAMQRKKQELEEVGSLPDYP